MALPPGFTPAAPGSKPNLLIPTAWHIMMYKDGAGYGPPNVLKVRGSRARLATPGAGGRASRVPAPVSRRW